ncbi:MAG: hypothetical protein AAF713_21490 [Pseudomonadota bacterium]
MQELAPFGVLNDGHKDRLMGDMFAPMEDWDAGDAAFRALMECWLERVTETIWPAWRNGAWQGGAAAGKEAATKLELEIAVGLYHGDGVNIRTLNEALPLRPLPGGRAVTQNWHYLIEDALVNDRRNGFIAEHLNQTPSFEYTSSREIASNFLAYSETPEITVFEGLFWQRMGRIAPAIFDIKDYLQRPRPYTAAMALGVEGFHWVTANGFTHTGVHPSLLSGHCIQGILGGCAVFEALLEDNAEIEPNLRAMIQQYMVDWGDRRVFAGVHYMTDNIGSWTLARKVIPHLFSGADQIEALAVDAIVGRSRVFADIVAHLPADSPARAFLLEVFPEGAPAA